MHVKNKKGVIRLALQYGWIGTLCFISLIGCDDTRTINEEELVSIKYAKGEQTPFSGTVITKYDDGKLLANAKYEYGVRNGPFTIYFKNGNVHIESSHLNSELHGDYIKYYENGAVQSTGELINGNLIWLPTKSSRETADFVVGIALLSLSPVLLIDPAIFAGGVGALGAGGRMTLGVVFIGTPSCAT